MPKVSVIMPVYNGEAYLREAIESVLQQTFGDFEFIIINDGSTDGSESIILSYRDTRIVYLQNEGNKGVIYTLNRCVKEAKGELIARMDADDIAMPGRLEKQVSYMESHPEVAVLATTVQLVDAEGQPIANWKEDRQSVSEHQIRSSLASNNCIAHPSVMVRKDVYEQYLYEYDQKYSEDYDLWLRLISENKRIAKLPEPLLKHRILPTSVTRFKKVNVFFRVGKVKLRFMKKQLKRGKFNSFVFIVGIHALGDFVKGFGKEIKQLRRKNEVQATAS